MPAFDLSGMYKDLAESIPGYGNVAKGAMQQQELMNRDLEYQKAKEDFEAQKGLRALFAQNPNASIEEAAQYSPAFAQELMKNRFAMQKDLLGMEETKQKMEKGQKEMSEMDRKIVSETLGPIAEHALITGDMEGYKQAVGRAASELKSRGISLPMNFDPAQHTPEAVLRNSAGGGYRSQLLEQQRDVATQQQLSQVPGRPSGPSVQMTPEGYALQVPGATLGVTPFNPNAGQQPMFRNPPTGTGLAAPGGPSGNMPPQQPMPQGMPQAQPPMQSEPQSNIPAQDIDAFRAYYQSLPPGREKDAARNALAKAVRESVPNGGVHEDQAQFITPQELPSIRAENKARETAAVKEAEAEVGRKEENTRILESFERAGDPSRIEKLIEESTSGPVESKLAAAKGFSGKGTPGMEKIAELGSIAGELRKTIERSPGAQSDKDVALAALDAADIANPNKPYNERLAGFKEFTRIMNVRKSQMEKSSAGQPPKEAVVGRRKAALDMFQKGEIDEAKFHQMWGE